MLLHGMTIKQQWYVIKLLTTWTKVSNSLGVTSLGMVWHQSDLIRHQTILVCDLNCIDIALNIYCMTLNCVSMVSSWIGMTSNICVYFPSTKFCIKFKWWLDFLEEHRPCRDGLASRICTSTMLRLRGQSASQLVCIATLQSTQLVPQHRQQSSSPRDMTPNNASFHSINIHFPHQWCLISH